MRISEEIMDIITMEASRCHFLATDEKWFIYYSIPLGGDNIIGFGSLNKGRGTLRQTSVWVHPTINRKVTRDGFTNIGEEKFIDLALKHGLFGLSDLSSGQFDDAESRILALQNKTETEIDDQTKSLFTIDPRARERFMAKLLIS